MVVLNVVQQSRRKVIQIFTSRFFVTLACLEYQLQASLVLEFEYVLLVQKYPTLHTFALCPLSIYVFLATLTVNSDHILTNTHNTESVELELNCLDYLGDLLVLNGKNTFLYSTSLFKRSVRQHLKSVLE